MTIDEAIVTLEEVKRQSEILRDNPTTFYSTESMEGGIATMTKHVAAYDMAISALRAQKAMNEPLTWDELVEMRGNAVWIVEPNAHDEYWAIVGEMFCQLGDPAEIRDLFIGLTTYHDPEDCACKSRYGIDDAWVAYRYPPESR